MPVIVEQLDGRVQVRLMVDVDSEGKPVYKTKTLSGIKPTASPEDIMSVMQGLISLQKYPMTRLIRIDESELLKE